MAFIGDSPLDVLPFRKLHGLSDGCGEVDVPLLTLLALNELNFGRKSHMAISSYLTRHLAIKKRLIPCAYLVIAKLQLSPKGKQPLAPGRRREQRSAERLPGVKRKSYSQP